MENLLAVSLGWDTAVIVLERADEECRKAIDITRARGRHAIPTGELPERVSTIGTPDGTTLDLWEWA